MERKSGVLLHVSSLPSGYGIGNFGVGAREFVDFLSDAGFRVWQVLPLCMPDEYNSPYKSRASYSINPYFIDLEALASDGLITAAELGSAREGGEYLCEYERLAKERIPLLRRAAERAAERAELSEAVADFLAAHPEVRNAARFLALRDANGGAPWQEWKSDKCDPVQLFSWEFIEYEAYSQWLSLKQYANLRGIEIIGDLPMYSDLDSADVYFNREAYRLDPDGYPTCVAGVPPDAFAEDGQLWGNPLYNYSKMKPDGYAFWRRRIECSLELFDGVRIDHFRAFEAYWSVPAGARSAREGRWVKGAGRALVDVIRAAARDRLVIAEDLGVITDGVRSLLKYSRLPGMRVLQFAFSDGADNLHLPHNHTENTVVYTGTHDNNTSLGYLYECSGCERDRVISYLGCGEGDLTAAARGMVRAALASTARLAVLPMQDLLGYGADTRMNTPGTSEGNWAYRLAPWQLSSLDREAWRRINSLYGRI